MKKHIPPFLSLILLFLLLLNGCRNEEEEVTPDFAAAQTSPVETRSIIYPPAGGFFQSDGVDENLHKIITHLKEVNDSTEFTASFVENYGYPLWQHAKQFHNGNKIVYAVPVRNEEEIATIWLFEMNPIYTRYYVFPRPEEDSPLYSLDWMFDYFNVELSCYVPDEEGEVMQFETPQTRSVIAIEYCNDIYTGYTDSQGNVHLEYRYTHCWTEYVYILDNGWSGGGGGNGGGDPGGIHGGGGGGGVGGTLPVSPNGNLSELFLSTSNLTDDVAEKLQNAINDIRDNCYSEAIYNYLVGKGTKFSSIEFDANMMGQGSFVPATDKLKFQRVDDINFSTLYHEMFHLFQKHEGSYTGANDIGMMEYERTLFEDIAYTVQHMKKGKISYEDYKKRDSPWVYEEKGPDEQRIYEDWLKRITQKGKSYPTYISNDDFKKWAVFFGEGNRRYEQYNYNVEYSPKSLTKALELAKNNCRK